MASGVEELLDMLFEMIDEAKNAPLSSDKCVIERDRALDLIDDIRSQFPIELSEAKKMMANRAELIASAKREVESIRKAAEDKARQMLSEDTILLQAKQRANEMVQQAEDRSRELKRSANEYCEDALRRTEEAVAEAYDEIKKSRAKFRAAASATASTPTANPSGGRPIYDAAADED
jgi:membrane protein involved in colicin uptake